MAETYTSNLGLTKPDYDSPADISVINSNMDKIDNAVANAGKVKSVNNKIGDVTLTAADVGALPSDGTAVNANALNGKDASYYMSGESNRYTLTASVVSDKVEMAYLATLFVSGNIGYFRVSFHVKEKPDNQEGVITITGFPKEVFMAEAFLAKGTDSVFFSAGCSVAGNTLTIISNYNNDVGQWFNMPVIVFLKN